MNKILIGAILGAGLGVLDGATAWFTPEVRTQMLGIIIGSTFKGVIAGVAAGIFARKVQSTAAGVIFGLVVGLALAYAVAAMGDKYYFEIMLPGGAVGAILGWATQRYGRPGGSHRAGAAAMTMLGVVFLAAGAHAEEKPAGGAAVEETLFAGSPHEMITMYTVDGDGVAATHYCSSDNQPTCSSS